MFLDVEGSHYRAPMNPDFVRKVHAKRKAEDAARQRARAKEAKAAAIKMLAEAVPGDKHSMRWIIANIALAHDLTPDQITGPSRLSHIGKARIEAIITIRRLRPDVSTPAIGKAMNRDHTSILHTLNRHGGNRA